MHIDYDESWYLPFNTDFCYYKNTHGHSALVPRTIPPVEAGKHMYYICSIPPSLRDRSSLSSVLYREAIWGLDW